LKGKKAISQKGLLDALRLKGLSTPELVLHVSVRGVGFELTPEIEGELAGAGAPAELLAAVREKSEEFARARRRALPNYIPLLNGNVAAVRFYESPHTSPPREARNYTTAFPEQETRYICWELEITHSYRPQATGFNVHVTWEDPDGNRLTTQDTYETTTPRSSPMVLSWGYGNDAGGWLTKAGVYKVLFYIGGELAAEGSFLVYKGHIPAADGFVTNVRFYEEGETSLPRESRRYSAGFPKSGTRFVMFELDLLFRGRMAGATALLKAEWRYPDGKVLGTTENQFLAGPADQRLLLSNGMGHKSGKRWRKKGLYTVFFYVQGRLVAKGEFTIF
jgi:hypothetical protein